MSTVSTHIPGGGWQIAGRNDDGSVWIEPVVAWHLTGSTGVPMLAEAGSLIIAEYDDSDGKSWLVPPGADSSSVLYQSSPPHSATSKLPRE